jgi:hypothetical protein
VVTYVDRSAPVLIVDVITVPCDPCTRRHCFDILVITVALMDAVAVPRPKGTHGGKRAGLDAKRRRKSWGIRRRLLQIRDVLSRLVLRRLLYMLLFQPVFPKCLLPFSTPILQINLCLPPPHELGPEYS